MAKLSGFMLALTSRTDYVASQCKVGADTWVDNPNFNKQICDNISLESQKCADMEAKFSRFLKETTNPNSLCQFSTWEMEYEQRACEALR
jgi:hypothetical protein